MITNICCSLAFKTTNIFEYFDALLKDMKLPDIETLLPLARSLYLSYSMASGHDTAVYNDVDECVPRGTIWTPVPIEESSLDIVEPNKDVLDNNAEVTRRNRRREGREGRRVWHQ